MKRRTLNRLNDYFFKRLMGDDKRSDLTLRFLNLILNRTEEKLKPVIGINLLDFILFDDIDAWHNVARFRLDDTDKILTDCMSLHFLELPKLKYSDIKKVKKLEAWGAYFSGRCNQEELEVLVMNEPLLKKAVYFEKAFISKEKMLSEKKQLDLIK